MSGVSVDSVPQTNPTSSRTRSGRDAAPASNDEFGLLVEDGSAAPQRDSGSPAPKRNDTRTASSPAPNGGRDASPLRQNQDTPARNAQISAPDPKPVDASRPQDKPVEPVAMPVVPDEPAVGDADTQPADASAVPVDILIGLQAAISAPVDTTIESSEAVKVANPSAAMPGQTAALALARVAQDTATGAAPDPAAAKASPDTAALPEAVTSDSDAPPQPGLPLPAVAAPDQTNTALETTIDLTTRIPAQTIEVEADAKLQATIVAPTDNAAEHERLIATTIAQPLLAPQKPSASSDAPALKPSDNPGGADQSNADAKPTDALPSGARHAAAQTTARTDDTPVAPQSNDKPAATHAQSTPDNSALPDPTASALPAQPQVHATATAPLLTATASNPNVAVPVAALAIEIASNVQIGRSRFEIRLDPPELGRIEVKLDVDRQGQVTSHIIVEKAATLDLLRRDAPQLERALQDAGLKTSDNGLQFSLRDQQSQTGRQDTGDDRRNVQHLMITEDETAPRDVASRGYGRMLGASGGIDMRV